LRGLEPFPAPRRCEKQAASLQQVAPHPRLEEQDMPDMKLNLGCGQKHLPGYINVDKYDTFMPDIVQDLEQTPWPFATGSVSEIQLTHVLEHLGQMSETFLRVMIELYRVCRHGARIHVKVPHPRSDGFLGDPTHVRPITPSVLSLFSKEANRHFEEQGWPNTRLAYYLEVDFRMLGVSYSLTPYWKDRVRAEKPSDEQLNVYMQIYNNVVDEISIELEVLKDTPGKEANDHSRRSSS
jgi:hypothetical protein